MFAGHAALALLAKAARPRIPIVLLMPVAFAPDILESVFSAFGHQNRELSHSLVSVGIGATLVALIYLLTTRATVDALVVWLMYVAHWPADFITGTKPTWPGGPSVGLHFYGHPFVDALIESVIVIICWIVYRRATLRSRTPALSPHATSAFIPIALIAAQIAFDVLQHGLIS